MWEGEGKGNSIEKAITNVNLCRHRELNERRENNKGRMIETGIEPTPCYGIHTDVIPRSDQPPSHRAILRELLYFSFSLFSFFSTNFMYIKTNKHNQRYLNPRNQQRCYISNLSTHTSKCLSKGYEFPPQKVYKVNFLSQPI